MELLLAVSPGIEVPLTVPGGPQILHGDERTVGYSPGIEVPLTVPEG